jgi:predicted AAA+ superfamily ATPase
MVTELKREHYLKDIRPEYDSSLIKIIIGMRRCGKSTLLKQIIDEIRLKGVDEGHIIYINLEVLEYDHLKEKMVFYHHVKSLIKDDGKYYLFFDEIQNVKGFEEAVNSLNVELNCSVFITGSNGKLLSGELATVLTGRFRRFTIMPFTFREVKEYRKLNNIEFGKNEFEDYMRWGGIPFRFESSSERSAGIFVEDLYDSIINKDVIQRYGVRDVDLLNRILLFAVENSSNIFSAVSIKKFLASEGRSISSETIYNYLDHIASSLIINRVKRFDIEGKRILQTMEKLYAADTSLMYIRRENPAINFGACLETIVHNELMARGYTVSIGRVKGDKEVDFIAKKDGNISYFQVCFTIHTEGTADREFGSLEAIGDNLPKYVLSMDTFLTPRNGIEHLNVVDDFLLSDRF